MCDIVASLALFSFSISIPAGDDWVLLKLNHLGLGSESHEPEVMKCKPRGLSVNWDQFSCPCYATSLCMKLMSPIVSNADSNIVPWLKSYLESEKEENAWIWWNHCFHLRPLDASTSTVECIIYYWMYANNNPSTRASFKQHSSIA